MRWMGVLCLALGAGAQDNEKPGTLPPKVDPARVDEAIKKGCEWLLAQGADIQREFKSGSRNQPAGFLSRLELAVLTLAHSGLYPEDHAEMAKLIEAMVKKELHLTYPVALQAMALQKINPRKYQWRLAQCAQFLVDNQCENGQWDYGEKTNLDKLPSIATESAGNSGDLLKIRIIRRRTHGPPNGDNSNSQYAALGLRACVSAGIVIDKQILIKAREWWTKSQNTDGGWGYNDRGQFDGGRDEVVNGVSNSSYGSMTAGAVGALAICDFLMSRHWKGDPPVVRGLEWLSKNFDVKKHPRQKAHAFYTYYLYALERAGMLYGTEKFGPHEWYPAGANHLLDIQQADGRWQTNEFEQYFGHPLNQTCFAILFLRRGTAPLEVIKTGESQKK